MARLAACHSFLVERRSAKLDLTVKTRKNYMTLSEASAIVTAAIGRSISYSAIAGGEYRNFTILSVDKIACAIKTGNWYTVANVIDHDDGDIEKVRSLHIDGIF